MPEVAYKCCSRCKERKPAKQFSICRASSDGLQYRCKPCDLESVEEWRGRNPEKQRQIAKRKKKRYQARYPEQAKAHRAILNAVAHGSIVKPSNCERCGRAVPKPKLHAHHFDYSKPREVEWICRACHAIEHGQTPRKSLCPLP